MAENPEFGRRLREAKRAWEMRHDQDLTFEQIGVRIGAAMGRAAYSHQGVRKWFTLGTEPAEFAIVEALAALLGVRAAWLFTGEGEMVAPPNPGGAEKHTRPVAPRPAPSGSGFVITPPEHLERAVSFPRPEKPAAKPAAKRASGEKKRRG